MVKDNGLLNLLMVCAPHSGKPEEEKENFWNELFHLVSLHLRMKWLCFHHAQCHGEPGLTNSTSVSSSTCSRTVPLGLSGTAGFYRPDATQLTVSKQRKQPEHRHIQLNKTKYR